MAVACLGVVVDTVNVVLGLSSFLTDYCCCCIAVAANIKPSITTGHTSIV